MVGRAVTRPSIPVFDAVVIGAGFAGSAAAAVLAAGGARVLVLERQERHEDLVRGEWLSPWGVAEARALHLEEALDRAGAWTIRWWPQWDETIDPARAPMWDLSSFTPGVRGALSFRHHRACEEMARQACHHGAEIRLGVRDITLTDTPIPRVYWLEGDRPRQADGLHVIGAGGRNSPVGRQVGIELKRYVHHWGAGLAVSGIDGWPADTQAMGTEGDVMYFVFPQGQGRARLYLNFPTDHRRRFAGRAGAAEFLRAFRLASLPAAGHIAQARPDGPLASYPSVSSWTETPARGRVVLIGDEAGANDPVLGTGLSNSLRDARLVSEAILCVPSNDGVTGGSRGSSGHPFATYVAERTERMRRLRFAADLVGVLMAEFGAAARQRRATAWERARENPNLVAPLLANVIAPDLLPEFAFHRLLRERLLGRGDGAATLAGIRP
jgi:flavin-dependent dehydrogenase